MSTGSTLNIGKSATCLHSDCWHLTQNKGGQTTSSEGHPWAMLDCMVTSKGQQVSVTVVLTV